MLCAAFRVSTRFDTAVEAFYLSLFARGRAAITLRQAVSTQAVQTELKGAGIADIKRFTTFDAACMARAGVGAAAPWATALNLGRRFRGIAGVNTFGRRDFSALGTAIGTGVYTAVGESLRTRSAVFFTGWRLWGRLGAVRGITVVTGFESFDLTLLSASTQVKTVGGDRFALG